MAKLLSDSDSDPEFTINEEFAKNYDKWRGKEELQILKDRYGENADTGEDSSSSEESEDDEVGVEITPEFEKGFLKTLSLLKSKDPRIYDKSVRFFKDDEESERSKKSFTSTNSKKSEPMYLRDYERKVIVEKQGYLSDEEDESGEEQQRSYSPTYLEEQQKLKESFRTLLENSDDEDATDLLQERVKSKEEKEAEEEEYRLWLKGEKDMLTKDKELESDLKPLHDYWNDPKLEDTEVFLRDFVLNKHATKDCNAEAHIPSYEEIVNDSERLSEDEATLEEQAQFEHKYNFRFEEPDPEFIKRFPRTIKESLRRKDEGRKQKREEIRKRKQEEKAQKQEELKRLKALKRKEIMEKIEHLKDITGNSKIGFDSIDLSCDFDPEKYDEQMKKLFDEEYYAEKEDQKPVFPTDEEWDSDADLEQGNIEENELLEHEWHSEDPEFNMDADYDPSQEQEINELTNSKRKQKKKSKFAQILTQNRDTIMKEKKSLIEAFDEYYNLDYCDMVGDTPIRFRYRKVEPNDFGLSAEEILFAKDRELNQWCSLKKTCQYRSKEEELYDVQAFRRKAQNELLKKKVLASLYQESEKECEKELATKKRKRRKKKNRSFSETNEDGQLSSVSRTVTENAVKGESENNKAETVQSSEHHTKKRKKMPTVGKQNSSVKRKKSNLNLSKVEASCLSTSTDRLKAFGINPKKVRNKIIYGKK